METPNILKGIAACRKQGLAFDIMSTSFFLSRRSLKASAHSGMPVWQDKLFIALAGSAEFGDGLFSHPGRARGGDRGAGHDLSWARGKCPIQIAAGSYRETMVCLVGFAITGNSIDVGAAIDCAAAASL